MNVLLHVRQGLFADENTEQADEGDRGRRRRAYAEQRIDVADEEAGAQRQEIGFHAVRAAVFRAGRGAGRFEGPNRDRMPAGLARRGSVEQDERTGEARRRRCRLQSDIASDDFAAE